MFVRKAFIHEVNTDGDPTVMVGDVHWEFERELEAHPTCAEVDGTPVCRRAETYIFKGKPSDRYIRCGPCGPIKTFGHYCADHTALNPPTDPSHA